MNWFLDDDRNTTFFHAMVRKRHNAKDIHRVMVGDSI